MQLVESNYDAAMIARDDQDRYRLLFETITVGVVFQNAQGEITAANPAAQRLLGLTLSQLQGRTSVDPGWKVIHADGSDFPSELYPALVALETGRQIHGVIMGIVQPGELEYRWLSVTAIPLTPPGAQRPTQVFISFEDISERRKAEQDLIAERDLFQVLMDTMPEVIYFKDTASRFVRINQAHACLYGLTDPAQAIGKTDADFVSSEYASVFLKDEREVLDTGVPRINILEQLVTDRQTYWLLTTKMPIVRDGVVTGMVGISRDVTSLRQAEEAQARLAAIVETSRDAIFSKSLDGVITSWNLGAEHLYGYTAAEIIGQSVTLLVPPEELAELAAILDRVHRGEHIAEYVTKRVCKDGIRVPVAVTIAPVYDECGAVVGATAVARDVRARIAAETAVRESEQRFRLLSEHVPELVWTCLPNGACDYLNARWVAYTGIPQAEQLGSAWLSRLHPDDVEPAMQVWQRAVEQHTSFDTDCRLQRHDGIYRWFKTRAQAMCDDEGRILKWFGTNTDIDELRTAEEALRVLNEDLEQRVAARTAELHASNQQFSAINQELEAFAYSVSHDLRAPLRSMGGFSEILLTSYSAVLDERGRHYLERVHAGAQQMGHLIDDLLALSRLTRAEMRVTAVDMSALAVGVAGALQQTEPGRAVTWAIAEGLSARCDGALVRIVLDNLLGNAWKFTRKHPAARIELGVRLEQQETVYFVRDDGAGFDMAYADKLFGAFQRLHTTREFEGTGIGLAIVQRIIHRHGGRVWAEGSVDHGATISFTLAASSGEDDEVRT